MMRALLKKGNSQPALRSGCVRTMASDEERQAQAILSTLNNLKEQRQMIISKIAELDSEHTEHNLVISTLEPLPPERRCFRMIGEVLVERNNAEVLQAVIQNRDNVRAAPFLLARVCRVLPLSGSAGFVRLRGHAVRFTACHGPPLDAAVEKGDGRICRAPEGQRTRAARSHQKAQHPPDVRHSARQGPGLGRGGSEFGRAGVTC